MKSKSQKAKGKPDGGRSPKPKNAAKLKRSAVRPPNLIDLLEELLRTTRSVRPFAALNPGDINVTNDAILTRNGSALKPGLYTIQDGDNLSTSGSAGNDVWFADRDGRIFNLAPSSEINFTVTSNNDFDIEVVNGTVTIAGTGVGPSKPVAQVIFIFHIKVGGVRLGATGTVFSVSRSSSRQTNSLVVLQGEVTVWFNQIDSNLSNVAVAMSKKVKWKDSPSSQPAPVDI